MLRLVVKDGWYCDVAGVGGDYVALVRDSHLQTSRGTVPLPGENVLYVRAAVDGFGILKLCGVGHQSDQAWEYPAWQPRGLAHGVSACIFDHTGTLRIATRAQGSQGYRYINDQGQPVTGDDTYNSQTALAQSYGLTELWEWTKQGDLYAGQNSKDECILVCPAGTTYSPHLPMAEQLARAASMERRVLEPGACRFIRFVRVGSVCAVALWKPQENCAVLFWFTVDEIATLPLESTPPPDPDNPPTNPTDPEPSMQLPDAIFATLKAVRPKYPTPLGQLGAALLNEVAWIHRAEGWGIEAKTGGNVCPQPTTGRTCGCDILRTATQGWDVLQDTEGDAIPVQSESGPADPARFVAPVAPPDIIDPPDPPPSDLTARVTALEAQVAVQGMRLQDQAAALLLLAGRVAALEQTPPASGLSEAQVVALIRKAFALATVTGTTGSRYSHAHSVNLGVTLP